MEKIGLFETNNAGNTITRLNYTPSGELTIPDNINGKTITAIGERVFYNCADLISITIPETVTSIGSQAFYGCSSLEKAIILNNSGVVTLGSGAFDKTSDTLKLYVQEELYNTYKTATNWRGYASKLDKIYMYWNKPYILEPVYSPGDEAYTFLWIYSSNSYGGDGPYGYGEVGGDTYTYCYIRLDGTPGYFEIHPLCLEESYVLIMLGEDANGLEFNLFNYQQQYVMNVAVENGILCIPLMDFVESGALCRFYIVAVSGNNTVVGFDLSCIEIVLLGASYL